jgi:hypothetical protein
MCEYSRIKVIDRLRLRADEIVESIGSVRIDEAVADPLGSFDTTERKLAQSTTDRGRLYTFPRFQQRSRKPLPLLHPQW